jgi:hypothetical protein
MLSSGALACVFVTEGAAGQIADLLGGQGQRLTGPDVKIRL